MADPPIPTGQGGQHVEVEGLTYHTLLEPSSTNTGPVVVLIHALMSNLHMWNSTVQTLHAAGYRTLRFDHIGHDLSPPPSLATLAAAQRKRRSAGSRVQGGQDGLLYHLDDLTRHVHLLVKKCTGSTEIHAVIGCSIGGVMALRYAMLYPDAVTHVISIAAPGITALEDKKILWTKRIELFQQDLENGTEKLCQETVARWVPGERERDDSARQRCLEQVRTCGIEGYTILADAIRGYDYAGQVGELCKGRRKMVVIVAGAEDGAIDLEGLRALAGRIDGARFVVMEETGHLPPVQRRDDFERLMVEAVGKV